MTEAAAPAAPAAPVAPEATGGKAADAPLPNMTGEEAKAYVEALKAKKTNPAMKAPMAAPQIEAKPEKQTAQEIAKEVARKFKVKVDGQEKEVDENELVRGYSHQQAANKALQEGKYLRKQSEELINLLKDPNRFFEVAKQLGHDPRKISEEYLVEILNEELLDPKERENKQLRRELDARRAAEEERQRAAQHEQEHAMKEHFAKKYSSEFIPALQETRLPPTKETIAKMAFYIHQAAELKMPMTAKEAAQLVREDLLKVQKNVLAETDPEALIELLGPEVAAKIRKHDLSKLRSPEQFLKTPEPNPEHRRNRRAPSKRLTHSEWRNFNRS